MTMQDQTKTSNAEFIAPDVAFSAIADQWSAWAKNVPFSSLVIGISGGVDSTCAAALACKLFGSESVIGVSMPNGMQKDIEDANAVFEHLNIKQMDVNIGEAFHSLTNQMKECTSVLTDQCTTNLPARLRMSTLFGVAQCLNGIVVNTCNRSEDVLGWNTLFGDDCGCYAPLKNLTKTEVRDLAKWLGVPDKLADKTPIDGLQPMSDEEKFGFTYDVLDWFIRGGHIATSIESHINEMHRRNKFKLDIVRVPAPEFNGVFDRFAM
jgi:NAD+ synthase